MCLTLYVCRLETRISREILPTAGRLLISLPNPLISWRPPYIYVLSTKESTHRNSAEGDIKKGHQICTWLCSPRRLGAVGDVGAPQLALGAAFVARAVGAGGLALAAAGGAGSAPGTVQGRTRGGHKRHLDLQGMKKDHSPPVRVEKKEFSGSGVGSQPQPFTLNEPVSFIQ